MTGTVLDLIRDEGSIVVFGVRADGGQSVLHVAVDHRVAQNLIPGLTVEFEGWQVIGRDA